MDDPLDPVFAALADPTRRRLLDLLKDGPRTTGELCSAFPGLSRFAVMKHVAVLSGSGLVIHEREGRKRWNYLNAVPIREVYERWVSRYASAWASGLLGLKRLVEHGTPEPTPERPASIGQPTVGQDISSREADSVPRATAEWVEHSAEAVIAAPRRRVYAAITEDLTAWWPFRATPSPTTRATAGLAAGAGRISGGRDCGDAIVERWAGGGRLLAVVEYASEPEAVTVRGGLGLPGSALLVLRMMLADHGGGTAMRAELEGPRFGAASGAVPDAEHGVGAGMGESAGGGAWSDVHAAAERIVRSVKLFVETGQSLSPGAASAPGDR